MWYPTHATGYYVGIGDGRLTKVSCLGMPSAVEYLKPENNAYGNAFGTEIGLFRTSEGGMARMAISWDTPSSHGETGRVYGQKSAATNQVDVRRPVLPPGVEPGGHGGSHGYLTNDFIESVVLDRAPAVDVRAALNMTLAGVMAHESALKDGEWLDVPQFG